MVVQAILIGLIAAWGSLDYAFGTLSVSYTHLDVYKRQALWFALKDHYQEVMTLIGGMHWYWLVIILLWGIAYACVVGWILAVFAKRSKKDYTVLQGIANGFVGIFFSGITPSATGGQFAQAYICLLYTSRCV